MNITLFSAVGIQLRHLSSVLRMHMTTNMRLDSVNSKQTNVSLLSSWWHVEKESTHRNVNKTIVGFMWTNNNNKRAQTWLQFDEKIKKKRRISNSVFHNMRSGRICIYRDYVIEGTRAFAHRKCQRNSFHIKTLNTNNNFKLFPCRCCCRWVCFHFYFVGYQRTYFCPV